MPKPKKLVKEHVLFKKAVGKEIRYRRYTDKKMLARFQMANRMRKSVIRDRRRVFKKRHDTLLKKQRQIANRGHFF